MVVSLPMMPEEDVIALVVEGDHAAAMELRVVREEGGEHAAYRVAQARVEVVQDHLGLVRCGVGTVLWY